MQAILSSIGMLFGKLMYFIYNTIGFENYALSILLFTIVYKLILLPLSVKQIRSGQKMQEIQPEIARIQERYKHDKEKLNQETMKLYQDKGYNPASGCLPLLIQMPILIALFYVIRMPMSYMIEIPAKAVGEMTVASVQAGLLSESAIGEGEFNQIKDDPLAVYQKFSQKDYYFEIKLMDAIHGNPDIVQNAASLNEEHKQVLQKFNLKMFNVFNFGLVPTFNPTTLMADPATNFPPLILLILAVLTTYFTSYLMMPQQPPSNGNKKGAPNTAFANKSLLFFSPLMTLWIGLTTPCGLSFYWTINNILSFIQQKSLTALFKKGKEAKEIVKDDSKRS